MSARIQILVEPDEKHRIQRAARLSNMSVGAWLRELAMKRLQELEQSQRFGSADALRRFFAQLSEDDNGREPDWQEHKQVMAESLAQGNPKP